MKRKDRRHTHAHTLEFNLLTCAEIDRSERFVATLKRNAKTGQRQQQHTERKNREKMMYRERWRQGHVAFNICEICPFRIVVRISNDVRFSSAAAFGFK